MLQVVAVVGKAGFWRWECPCGARSFRWFRDRAEALAAGSNHDCRDCCDEEKLARLTEAR